MVVEALEVGRVLLHVEQVPQGQQDLDGGLGGRVGGQEGEREAVEEPSEDEEEGEGVGLWAVGTNVQRQGPVLSLGVLVVERVPEVN